jgi:hypothetical protein
MSTTNSLREGITERTKKSAKERAMSAISYDGKTTNGSSRS